MNRALTGTGLKEKEAKVVPLQAGREVARSRDGTECRAQSALCLLLIATILRIQGPITCAICPATPRQLALILGDSLRIRPPSELM